MGPASCGLAAMESGDGMLCRTGRVVEADIDLCGGPDGVGRARGRGRFKSASDRNSFQANFGAPDFCSKIFRIRSRPLLIADERAELRLTNRYRLLRA